MNQGCACLEFFSLLVLGRHNDVNVASAFSIFFGDVDLGEIMKLYFKVST